MACQDIFVILLVLLCIHKIEINSESTNTTTPSITTDAPSGGSTNKIAGSIGGVLSVLVAVTVTMIIAICVTKKRKCKKVGKCGKDDKKEENVEANDPKQQQHTEAERQTVNE
ncbi:uncharacterized protein LOC144448437 [Glandiceps talaboti]